MNHEVTRENFTTRLSNEYSDAIRILMAEDIDHRQFAIEVAAAAPGLFLKVAKNTPKKGTSHAPSREEDAEQTKIDKYLISLIKANKKIEAIKVYRTMTDLGLKEAKDYVDQLESAMSSSGCYGDPS